MCSPDAHRKLLQALLGKSSRDRMSPKMSFQRHDFYKFWHLQFEVFVRFVETRNSRFLQEFSASPRLFWSHSAQPWIRHWSFRNGHGGVCLINLKHNLQWWSWCSSWVQNISLLGTRGFLKQTPTKLLPAGWHASATNHKSDPTALRTLASPQRSCMFNHHIDTSKNTETLIFKMSWRCKTVRFRTKFVTWTLNLSVQGSQASRSCPHPSRLWCYP